MPEAQVASSVSRKITFTATIYETGGKNEAFASTVGVLKRIDGSINLMYMYIIAVHKNPWINFDKKYGTKDIPLFLSVHTDII